jgi:predicted transcriptional regulator of viral defense system
MDAESSPPSGDRALAELARAQWGVVSLEQLRTLELGRGAVARRVRSGRLHRLHAGVYAVGHARVGREGRYLAAVLAALAASGHRVVRFTWADVTQDTQRVARRLRALLEE